MLLALPIVTAQAGVKEAALVSTHAREDSLLIWQNGKTLLERYRGEPDARHAAFSITKSIVALSALAAAGTRSLNLDGKVADEITEWKNDRLKKQITVRELLNQTSGLNPGFESLYAHNLRDKKATVLRLPMEAEPGRHFAYGPANYETLELVMERALHQSSLFWVGWRIMGPLGLPTDPWRRDKLGRPFFSAGASLSARDLLKLGNLVRRRGWYGIIPLVPGSLVDEATRGSLANKCYGMGFWLNANAGKSNVIERDVEQCLKENLTASDWSQTCLSRRAPSDLIAMVGSEGQRVYISRSRNLVIVRQGRGEDFRDPAFLGAFFNP